MPDFDGFPVYEQALEAEFEVATYELLRSEPDIRASRLLYYRVPVRHAGPRLQLSEDIVGRRLFLFERAEGDNNIWKDLNSQDKVGASFLLLFNLPRGPTYFISPLYLFTWLAFALHYSTSTHHPASPPDISLCVCSNSCPNRCECLWPPRATSGSLSSRARSKPQSGTWAT